MRIAAKIILIALGILFILWLVQPLLFANRRAPILAEALELRQHDEALYRELPPLPAEEEAVDEAPSPERRTGLPAGHEVYNFERQELELTGPAAALLEHVRSGIIIDPEARRILWAKEDDQLVPIASMTKLMTMLVTLQEMERREDLTPETMVTISAAAASMGGTQVWMPPGATHSMKSLMMAAMVRSANDAAYALGQAVAPDNDIDKFVTLMNRTAREIGMRRARFYNTHGLPGTSVHYDNRASALDMMVLAIELHRYPQALRYGGRQQANFVHNNGTVVTMTSHNHLLKTAEGVYGMKTGFTNRAGFCLTVACTRNGRVLLAAAMGFPQRPLRDSFMSALLDWGYEQSDLLDAESGDQLD